MTEPKRCTCWGGPCEGACGYDPAAWDAYEAEHCPCACPSGPYAGCVCSLPRHDAGEHVAKTPGGDILEVWP